MFKNSRFKAYFSKNESKGVAVLILLLMGYFAIPKLFKNNPQLSTSEPLSQADQKTNFCSKKN
jgi:hypothetical protein